MKNRRFAVTAVVFTFFIFMSFFASPVNAATDGKKAYELKCKTCHAINGKGSKSVADLMKIDSALLDLTTDERKKKTDAELTKVVREGKDKMKAIPKNRVNDSELKAIICHIRSLQEPKK